ncbi:hypothetical protein T439DRAFT_349588 [Meredithblackwellia eburnea MCA 4105]
MSSEASKQVVTPPEVLLHIFSYLHNLDSPCFFDVNADLLSAALVSKQWSKLAREVLLKDLHLSWRPSTYHSLVTNKESPNLERVRGVTLVRAWKRKDWKEGYPQSRRGRKQLGELFDRAREFLPPGRAEELMAKEILLRFQIWCDDTWDPVEYWGSSVEDGSGQILNPRRNPTKYHRDLLFQLTNLRRLSLIRVNPWEDQDLKDDNTAKTLGKNHQIYLHGVANSLNLPPMLAHCQCLRSLIVIRIRTINVFDVLSSVPETLEILALISESYNPITWHRCLTADTQRSIPQTPLEQYQLREQLPRLRSLRFSEGQLVFVDQHGNQINHQLCILPPEVFSAQFKCTQLEHLTVGGFPDEFLLLQLPPTLKSLSVSPSDSYSSEPGCILTSEELESAVKMMVGWKEKYGLHSLRVIDVGISLQNTWMSDGAIQVPK